MKIRKIKIPKAKTALGFVDSAFHRRSGRQTGVETQEMLRRWREKS